jgi:tetratricopeptide (TPR) repeat protein
VSDGDGGVDPQAPHPMERFTRAVSLLDPVLSQQDEDSAAARIVAAEILTSAGVAWYVRQPRFTDGGLDYRDQKRYVTAAHDTWQRALRLDPNRIDAQLYLSNVEPLLDRDHPERAEPRVVLADRLLEADVLNMIGDAYFQAGLMTEARSRYARSLDVLNLPQRKNFRAQKGLGGL